MTKVEGLETVEGQIFKDGVWQTIQAGSPTLHFFPTRGLVARSQAEAIIEVKDEAIDRHREAQVMLGRKLNEVISDNAALTARVKELEHVVKSSGKIYSAKMRQIEALETRLATAKANIESLVYVYEVNLNNHNDGEDYDIYVEACRFIDKKPQL